LPENAHKLLVIDDEKTNLDLLSAYLGRRAEFEILTARDGREALWMFREDRDIALLLLDIVMPEMDGWEVLRAIRKESDVPVIMVTARDDVGDIVKAFTLGVDDYITKPFKLPEVEVRVEAVLQRIQCSSQRNAVLHVGTLKVDGIRKTATLGEKELELSPKGFELLQLFAENPGTVISDEMIIRRLWQDRRLADSHDVKQIVYLLRQKIEADPKHPELLITARGFGYKLVAQSCTNL